jgi:EpsD family peptidyl-prolyl cis-trans isomerase
MTFTKRAAALVAVLLAGLLAGCGGEEKKTATQVAAKVNSGEITVHQVNNVLARTPNVPPDRAKDAGRQILERLIDQELLVQQANDKRLDRDPRVMQAIEASRREVLARAYLEQVAGGAAKPTEQELNDFYAKHPELFAERRIYNLREIAIGAKPELVPQLQEQLQKSKNLNEVVDWLKSQNVRYATSASVRAAEQLPLELLPRLHQMKDGQLALIPTPGALLLVHLAGSQSQPLDPAKAAPFIEQFLTNQRRAELTSKEVKALREQAKIEYVGDFAKTEPSPAAAAPAAEAVAATAPAAPVGETSPAAGAPAPPGVAPAATGQALEQKSVEKGVAGLK